MRRRVALVGSVAIHAACGLALIALRGPASPPAEATAKVELVDPAVEIAFVDLITARDSGGGGSRGRAATRPQIARVDRAPRRQLVRPAPSERSIADSPHADRSTSDSLAELARASSEIVDGAAGDGGDGGGQGGGHGRGIGRGVGTGLGDLASAGDPLPTVPAAPRASKARPAKLIYPTRERAASEGELYSARVIIDPEGYVVGAKLLHHAGPKDADAANMIFRFRYAPALDDDGHPIKSTIEQPFLVQ